MLATIVYTFTAGTQCRIQNLILWPGSGTQKLFKINWGLLHLFSHPAISAPQLQHLTCCKSVEVSVIYYSNGLQSALHLLFNYWSPVSGRLILFHNYLKSVKFRRPNCDWVEMNEQGALRTIVLLVTYDPPYPTHRDCVNDPSEDIVLLLCTSPSKKKYNQKMGCLSSASASAHPHWGFS